MRSESFRKGVKDGIPIGLGYFAVSFTFGMMAVADGLSIWQAVLISLTNVTSAGQFAGLEIMVMSGSYWEMALTQLIINLRYCLMSFSLAQKFRSIFHSLIFCFIAVLAFSLTAGVKPTKNFPSLFLFSLGLNVYPRKVNWVQL